MAHAYSGILLPADHWPEGQLIMPIWRKEHELARLIVHFIGMIVFGVGLTAICGQLSGQAGLYQWGHVGSMAVPTGICAILSGIGFFLISRGEDSNGEN